MSKLNDWCINADVHSRFSTWCKCERNSKLESLQTLLAAETTVDFGRYADALSRCKNFTQWKARALALQIPQEAVLASRTPTDALRLIGIRFMFDAKPGDIITADLRDRAYFMDAEVEQWLTQ